MLAQGMAKQSSEILFALAAQCGPYRPGQF